MVRGVPCAGVRPMNAPHEKALPPAADASIGERYAWIRGRTAALATPLSEEDACVQSMPDASPAKWHLAHTTWFFETFVLEQHEPGFKPANPAFRVLFNSYYNGVGDQHPRAQRGLLTRPSLNEVLDYRENVDFRMGRLIAEGRRVDASVADLVVLGLNHEQQHQELLLTDIKHLLSLNPLRPAYRHAFESDGSSPALEWHRFDGGMAAIGYHGAGFSFDNETPRHAVHLAPFRLGSRLATNAEYLRF